MEEGNKEQFRVIGTRPIRHDGADKVTGRAKYGADYSLADMLYGKVLRSPHAHAKIVSINAEKALKMPGVKAVITAADLPQLADGSASAGELRVNPRLLTSNILARDTALYNGHAIAAVAATSLHIAEEALAQIEVEYELLPPVMTLDDAMAPGAPALLPWLRKKGSDDPPSNIADHTQLTRGDVDSGFKNADYIVERELRTAMVHQGYIEPHNALAIYRSDGYVTIHCSTQGPFECRAMTANVLGIPPSNIKIVPAEIGGGFGGKITIYLEPVAALLSQKTGHPVKIVMTRAEVLRATGPTSGSWIKIKMGATRDGKLTAAKIWMAYEAGAFPGSPVGAGAMTVLAPYDIPNVLIDGYDVLVNRPKTAAYRAPGATNSAYGAETVIDELAEKCGMDPIDFRLNNAVQQGTPQIIGPPYKRIGFIEVCEALRDSDHYRSKLTGKYRGRGVAFGFWFNGGMQSSAVVNLHADGTASVVTGSVDIGGSRASMAMIAAEVLGLEVTDVRPLVADTDSIGQTDCTGGSRTTLVTGQAVFQAAHDVVRQLQERAAKLWKIPAEEVAFRAGKLISKRNGVPPMTIKELAAKFGRTGGPVSGRASLMADNVGPAFAGCCVDLEVDPDTGKTQVLRCTAVQDAGKAIHPSYVEGQMQGGTAQGLGWALNEEYIYDAKGILRNPTFLDYRMPTCLDLPLIETHIVEVPNPVHPLGIRGVGEVSIVPPPAAVANAMYNATGIRITQLPLSPPRVLKELRKAAADGKQSEGKTSNPSRAKRAQA
jgi:xanthine dehydrogenase molybdenum-binding subunit